MHKYLRSIGFSDYNSEKDIEKLLQDMVSYSVDRKALKIDEHTTFCEIRGETAPGMGIAIYGTIDGDGRFRREYYYPYMESMDITSQAECQIQRHTEKETFSGLLEEYRVGISLIFFMDNLFEYRKMQAEKGKEKIRDVRLSALCNEGKVLLPIKKTSRQIEMARVAAKDRNSLIEAAKNGDEDAIETLTIEDIDMYSQISKRVQ